MHNQYFRPIEGFFVTENDMVMEDIVVDIQTMSRETQVLYHRAGPRSEIRFSPDEVHAAIVTCGRLSPGVNAVIRELVIGLWFRYGVRDIRGIRSGYRGFYSSLLLFIMNQHVSSGIISTNNVSYYGLCQVN